MYGVVIHDYMRDILDKEFTIVYGETKKETIEKAWEILKAEDLAFDNGEAVTEAVFISEVISNEDDMDAVFIAKPYYLYIKLFSVPKAE